MHTIEVYTPCVVVMATFNVGCMYTSQIKLHFKSIHPSFNSVFPPKSTFFKNYSRVTIKINFPFRKQRYYSMVNLVYYLSRDDDDGHGP